MASIGIAKGVNYHLYKNVSGTYTKIGEATSRTVTINNATIDVTTADSNEFQALLSSIKSAESSVEGYFSFSTSNVKASDLITDILAGTEITVLFGTNASGDNYVKFDAQLTSVELGSTFDDKVTFSASLSSTGTIAQITKT